MKLSLLKKSQIPSVKWSGGTTNQLFIYPQEAEYSKRNFIFRISTASVEAEESVFTSLPGVKRKLMVLEGSLQINHKDKYSQTLHKFDTDEFLGDWETTAVAARHSSRWREDLASKVEDFNLMLREGAEGSLEAFILKEGEQKKLEASVHTFIYVYKGEIKIGEERAEEGDFVVVENADAVSFSALKNSELIITKVFR